MMSSMSEQKNQPLLVIEPTKLYAARVQYGYDVENQWQELKKVMEHTAITPTPTIINAPVFTENAMRLFYRGIKCVPVPFTHYTQLIFIGSLVMSDYLDTVD